MSDCTPRTIYLKQLYFNVGKTILGRNYNTFVKQIDYLYAEKVYFELLERIKTEKNILFSDKNGAFFNFLAHKFLAERLKNAEIVFCTLSPFYAECVLDSLFVPSESLYILNSARYDSDDDNAHCNGYMEKESLHTLYNSSIAKEFFDKAEKI